MSVGGSGGFARAEPPFFLAIFALGFSRMVRILTLLVRSMERWWGMLGFLAIPIFLVFAPVLIGGQMIAGEPFWYHIPLYTFYGEAIASGESFLWNPLSFSGFPSFVSVVGFLSPVHYLAFSLLPAAPAFHWLMFLAFVAAAFFTAALVRDLGGSFLGAYLAGLAYVSANIVYTNALTMANAVAFVPLVFWALLRIRGPHPLRYAAVATLVVGWGWLSAVPQYVLYAIVAAGVFSCFVAWQDGRFHPRILGTCLAAIILGTAIGLIQLLPTSLLASFSTRAGGLSAAEASIDPLLPTDAIRFFLPFFQPPLGIPFGSRGAEAFVYLGIIPLFFFLFSFFARGAIPRFFRWLFVGTAFTAIIYSPIFWLMGKVPLLDYFRGQSRWMMVGLFAASVLVGLGQDAFFKAEDRRRAVRFLKIFTGVSLLVTAAVLVGATGFALFSDEITAFSDRVVTYRFGPAPELIAFYGNIARLALQDLGRMVSLHEPTVFLPLLFIALGVATLWVLFRNGERNSWVGPLAAIAALNVVAVAPFTIDRIPAAVAADAPPVVEFLHTREGKAFAFLGDAAVDEALEASRDETARRIEREASLQYSTLFGNTNLYGRIGSAGYFDQIRSRNMARLLNLLGDPYTGTSDLRQLPTRQEQVRLFESRKPLLEFLGIRWIVSHERLDQEKFSLVTATSSENAFAIYENREARPMAYFVPAVTVVSGGDEDAFHQFQANNFSGAFVSCSGDACPEGERRYATGTVDILKQEHGELAVKTAAPGDGFLVVSQNNLPGWRAAIDGREVPIHTVNSVYIGIEVPMGAHEVEFTYSYPCPPRRFINCLNVGF